MIQYKFSERQPEVTNPQEFRVWNIAFDQFQLKVSAQVGCMVWENVSRQVSRQVSNQVARQVGRQIIINTKP